jgi:hypothetical protein
VADAGAEIRKVGWDYSLKVLYLPFCFIYFNAFAVLAGDTR